MAGIAAGLTNTPIAAAGPLNLVGYDPESAGVAGSDMAFGTSLSALHTNPALLPRVEDQFHVSFLYLSPNEHIALMPKPPGTDVPISIYDSNLGVTPGVQNRALPTVALANPRGDTYVNGVQTQLGLGVASSFGLARLHFAALLHLPLSGQGGAADITTHYDDEREAPFSNRLFFLRFGQWESIVSLLVGAGYQITDNLSIGVSGELAAAAVAQLAVYIPNASVQNYAQSNLDSQVSIRMRPIVGVDWTPTKWLALGVTFRDESYFSVNAQDDVQLWDSNQASTTKTIPQHTIQTIPIVFGWEPMEVSVGAGLRAGRLTMHLAATWQRWSTYQDNHAEHPEDLAAFPPSPFPAPTIDSSQFKFSDVVALQGGASFRVARPLTASVGAAWYPSPVPPQIGRTNFVDSSIFGVTVGQRLDFKVLKKRFALAAAVQVFWLLEQTTYKNPSMIVDEFPDSARTLEGNKPMPEAQGLQTNNPGFPGYTASGTIAAGHISLTHYF